MERRLAAILAADMVGYSRLMAADEAGTIERSDRPSAIPREISSRSTSVNAKLERFLSAGQIPQDGLR